jgi:hypothetical protein
LFIFSAEAAEVEQVLDSVCTCGCLKAVVDDVLDWGEIQLNNTVADVIGCKY